MIETAKLIGPFVAAGVAFALFLINQIGVMEKKVADRVAHRNLALFAYRLGARVVQLATDGKDRTRPLHELEATEFGLDAIDMKVVTPTSWLSGLLQIRFFWLATKEFALPKAGDLIALTKLRQIAAERMDEFDRRLWHDGIVFNDQRVAQEADFWRWLRAAWRVLDRRYPVPFAKFPMAFDPTAKRADDTESPAG